MANKLSTKLCNPVTKEAKQCLARQSYGRKLLITKWALKDILLSIKPFIKTGPKCYLLIVTVLCTKEAMTMRYFTRGLNYFSEAEKLRGHILRGLLSNTT